MYNRSVHSDPTPATPLPAETPELPVAEASIADETESTPEFEKPSTAQVNFDLEMMRNRLTAQLGELKDPYEEKLPEPKASPKFWITIGFSLAALFLVAYLFANIMRDAIESQPVTAGLEENILPDEETVDVTPAPKIEVTIAVQ